MNFEPQNQMPTNYRKSDLLSSKIQNPRIQMPSKLPFIVKPWNLMPLKNNETTVDYINNSEMCLHYLSFSLLKLLSQFKN